MVVLFCVVLPNDDGDDDDNGLTFLGKFNCEHTYVLIMVVIVL